MNSFTLGEFNHGKWWQLRVDLVPEILDNSGTPLTLIENLNKHFVDFIEEKNIEYFYIIIEIAPSGKRHIHSIMSNPQNVKKDFGNNIRNWWKSKKRSNCVLTKEQNMIYKEKSKKFQPIAFTIVKNTTLWWSYITKDIKLILLMSNLEIPIGIPPWCETCAAEKTWMLNISNYLKSQLIIFNNISSGFYENSFTDKIELYHIGENQYGTTVWENTDVGLFMYKKAIEYYKDHHKMPLSPKMFWKIMLNNDFVTTDHYVNSKYGKLF